MTDFISQVLTTLEWNKSKHKSFPVSTWNYLTKSTISSWGSRRQTVGVEPQVSHFHPNFRRSTYTLSSGVMTVLLPCGSLRPISHFSGFDDDDNDTAHTLSLSISLTWMEDLSPRESFVATPHQHYYARRHVAEHTQTHTHANVYNKNLTLISLGE